MTDYASRAISKLDTGNAEAAQVYALLAIAAAIREAGRPAQLSVVDGARIPAFPATGNGGGA